MKVTIEIKSNGKFFWHYQIKIQDTLLVFEYYFRNIENKTSILRLLNLRILVI